MGELKLKCSSKAFHKFVKDMDNILSKVQTHDIKGNRSDCTSESFVDSRDRLVNIELDFRDGHPSKIINLWVAADFVEDEIQSQEEKNEKRDP
tara:strand:+ start:824 stop:1102 length:279 start_codon:yes stop_codon:yes gene_type:complete